jgi:NAD(P)-dependent dehydrogenase (short-subunit alcohol dehydrogenase family)
MNVNVKRVWYSMKSEIEYMVANGGGAIVNTASIVGITGFPGHAPYTASKHAVLGLTKTAALQYAKQGMRINAVCPGAIATALLDNFIRELVLDDKTTWIQDILWIKLVFNDFHGFQCVT